MVPVFKHLRARLHWVRALTLTLAAFTLGSAPQMAPAQSLAERVTLREATLKVNISGRQRMLSQRITKAACLVARDVDFGPHYDQLSQAHALFVASDRALRDGSEEMGLPVETQQRVLRALAKIDAPWRIYERDVAALIETGTTAPDRLLEMNARGLEVLKLMNLATNTSARVYGAVTPDIPLALTVAVDVAGRQRMLTQKMVKEACLMAYTDDPAALAETLAQTAQIFDASLNALIHGFDQVGIIPAPTPEIHDKLMAVQGLWAEVRPLLAPALAGTALSDADLARVARRAEPLLKTMNEAVFLYSEVTSLPS